MSFREESGGCEALSSWVLARPPSARAVLCLTYARASTEMHSQTPVEKKRARNFASLPAVAPTTLNLREQLRSGLIKPAAPPDPHSSGGPHTSVSARSHACLVKGYVPADTEAYCARRCALAHE